MLEINWSFYFSNIILTFALWLKDREGVLRAGNQSVIRIPTLFFVSVN